MIHNTLCGNGVIFNRNIGLDTYFVNHVPCRTHVPGSRNRHCTFFIKGNHRLARGFPETLNGSLPYIPTFLVLLGLGVYHFCRCEHDRSVLFAAAGVFLLALFFRSIDMIVCPSFATGTHFLWHVLIAVALYLSMRALILNQPNRLGVGAHEDFRMRHGVA